MASFAKIFGKEKMKGKEESFFSEDGRIPTDFKKMKPIKLPVEIWLLYMTCLMRHDTFHDFKKIRNKKGKSSTTLMNDNTIKFRNILSGLSRTIDVKLEKLREKKTEFISSVKKILTASGKKKKKEKLITYGKKRSKRIKDILSKKDYYGGTKTYSSHIHLKESRFKPKTLRSIQEKKEIDKEIEKNIEEQLNIIEEQLEIILNPNNFLSNQQEEEGYFYSTILQELPEEIKNDGNDLYIEIRQIKDEVNEEIREISECIFSIITIGGEQYGGKYKKTKRRITKRRKKRKKKRKKKTKKVKRKLNKKRTRKIKRKKIKKRKTIKKSMKGGVRHTQVDTTTMKEYKKQKQKEKVNYQKMKGRIDRQKLMKERREEAHLRKLFDDILEESVDSENPVALNFTIIIDNLTNNDEDMGTNDTSYSLSEDMKEKNINILIEQICKFIYETVKTNYRYSDDILIHLYDYYFGIINNQEEGQKGGSFEVITMVLSLVNFASALESEKYLNKINTELKGTGASKLINGSYDWWAEKIETLKKKASGTVKSIITKMREGTKGTRMVHETSWEGTNYLTMSQIFSDDDIPDALKYEIKTSTDYAITNTNIEGPFIEWLCNMYPDTDKEEFCKIAKSLLWSGGKAKHDDTNTKRFIMDNCAGWSGRVVYSKEWKKKLSFCGSEDVNDSGSSCSWDQIHPNGKSYSKFNGVSLTYDTAFQIESEEKDGKKGSYKLLLQANESGGKTPNGECVPKNEEDGGCKYGSYESIDIITKRKDELITNTLYKAKWRYNYQSSVNNIIFKGNLEVKQGDKSKWRIWSDTMYKTIRRKATGDEGIILGALSKFDPESSDYTTINNKYIESKIAEYDDKGNSFRFAPAKDGLASWRTIMIIIYATQDSVNKKAIGGYVDMSKNGRVTIAGPRHNKNYLEAKTLTGDDQTYFDQLRIL
tara:strand:- start:162 stop:2969 length:2808 start_codon:yes stop_codon:yes gene_type:complete